MDVKIITEPDLDYSNKFKILLFDFNWEDIERYCHLMTNVNDDLVVYVFTQHDKNFQWCIHAANQSNAILVNLDTKTSNELLKGYLLSFKNAAGFGNNLQAVFAKEIYYDIAVWFTKIAQKYHLIES